MNPQDDPARRESRSAAITVLLHISLIVAWLPLLIPWALAFGLAMKDWLLPATFGAATIIIATIGFGRSARRERIHRDLPVLIGFTVAGGLVPGLTCAILVGFASFGGTWPANLCAGMAALIANAVWGAAVVVPTRMALNFIFHDSADRGVYCPHCDYDLRGVARRDRCPECGEVL